MDNVRKMLLNRKRPIDLKAKNRAHDRFDKLWKGHGNEARVRAYQWLAGKFGISRQRCHFSMFSAVQCANAIRFCEEITKAELNWIRTGTVLGVDRSGEKARLQNEQ